MKQLILPVFFILFVPHPQLFSQYKISGTVVDSVTVQPIKNAEVKIYPRQDSTPGRFLKPARFTDSTGYFSFDSLRSDSYILEVTAPGYSTFTLDLPGFENLEGFTTTIKLKQQTPVTEEIVVEEKKPLIEFNADKKIFNVDQSMLTKGGNAIDVLKKVPMVDVDAEDNVSLRGSRNVKILIDNKPPKFANLKQLPAELIQSVEIITNPSAKYEAEGVTGIINIVLKSGEAGRMLGFNGSVYLNTGTKDRYSGSFNLNLKKGKSGIFANGGGGFNSFGSANNSSTFYDSPVSSLISSGNYRGKSKYIYGSGGFEYEITKMHTIGIESYYNYSKFNNRGKTQSSSLNDAGKLTSYYTNNPSFDGSWKSYTLSFYYTGKLNNEGRELTGDVTYTDTRNPFNSSQSLQYYDSNYVPVNNTPSQQYNTTDQKSYNLNVQSDYTHPFSNQTKFEAGYKGTFRSNDNDYTYDTLDYSTGTVVRNYDLSNRFKLTEQINAVYGTFSSRLAQFGYKLGLRAEYTNSKGELLTANLPGFSFVKGYWSLFPSAGVSYKLGMVNELSLNYSRRVTRPMIYRLNPFMNKYNSKYIYTGNPGLTPEFTDSYELSFLFFSSILILTPTAFLRVSHDVISTYSYIIDSNITVTTYRNVAGSKAYGMDFIVSSGALGWLTLNGTLSLYNTKFEGDALTEYKAEEGFTWKANCRGFITLSDIFSIELYYNYGGKRFNANGYNLPMQNFDVGVSRNFFDKKVNVSLRVSDVFNTMKWGNETDGLGFTSSASYKYDSRVVFLNISYNFGNTTEYYQKSKKTKQNQNENSDQKEDNVR